MPVKFPNLHISKSKRCFNVKSSAIYIHMKTNILADFQICISIPLMSMSFGKYFFKAKLPFSASSTESKNRLKSLPRINILFSKHSKIQDLKYYNIEKQMVWKSRSKCTNISHIKTQFLAESSLSLWTLHLYDNLCNVLRFCKKKYTVSSQLKYHVLFSWKR